MSIGKQIKEAREAAKLSQQQVADHLGIPRSSYAVNEKSGSFSPQELKKILAFLGTDIKTWKHPNSESREIELLEKQIRLLEEKNEALQEKIQVSLGRIEERQQVIYALVRTALDFSARAISNQENKPLEKVKEEARKATDEHYKYILAEGR